MQRQGEEMSDIGLKKLALDQILFLDKIKPADNA